MAALSTSKFPLGGRWICLGLFAALFGGPAAAREAVIPPGQEKLLADMLGGDDLPGGCKYTSGSVEYDTVKVTYACPGGETTVELTHTDSAAEGAIETERFALNVTAGSPPAELMTGLVERIRAGEEKFEWTWIGEPGPTPGPWIAGLAAAALALFVFVIWLLRRRAA